MAWRCAHQKRGVSYTTIRTSAIGEQHALRTNGKRVDLKCSPASGEDQLTQARKSVKIYPTG
jgi:hypothetical protein